MNDLQKLTGQPASLTTYQDCPKEVFEEQAFIHFYREVAGKNRKEKEI